MFINRLPSFQAILYYHTGPIQKTNRYIIQHYTLSKNLPNIKCIDQALNLFTCIGLDQVQQTTGSPWHIPPIEWPEAEAERRGHLMRFLGPWKISEDLPHFYHFCHFDMLRHETVNLLAFLVYPISNSIFVHCQLLRMNMCFFVLHKILPVSFCLNTPGSYTADTSQGCETCPELVIFYKVGFIADGEKPTPTITYL